MGQSMVAMVSEDKFWTFTYTWLVSLIWDTPIIYSCYPVAYAGTRIISLERFLLLPVKPFLEIIYLGLNIEQEKMSTYT
ncbi:hypothetical protein BDW42DRAFT_160189 [Aspergillus taichungensis]|uniref:Uncharacterized protein n=1 Tax=Aspergillus taichungensis TaxID=482145 RepID=A0A2J5I6S4_9EURO|nr:hypothetical protein BDW42DRAFT_160189 [Aspergillus taichungensis]